MTKLKDAPIRNAVPAGGYVLISEPTAPGSAISTFAKVPASALGSTPSGSIWDNGASIWDGGASLWDVSASTALTTSLPAPNPTAAGVIDPTKPVFGNPTTQSVRDNFAAIKTQLDGLTGAALNVVAFGADPTGVADSTAAFTQAFTQAISTGLGVTCPGGTYLLSTLAFSIPQNKTLTVRGAGAGATTIKFSGVNGFDFTLAQYGGLNFQGMTLLRLATTPKYGGTALHIKAPGANANKNPCPNPILVDDITMLGTPERLNAWNTGIDLHNTNVGYLNNIRFLADNAMTPDPGRAGTAIWVHGDSDAAPSIDNHIRGLFAQGGFAGLVVTGWMQGLYLTDFTILGNSYGVYWDTTGTVYGELLGLCNGHLNSYRADIYMKEATQSLINNVLFLRFAADSGEWCAVDLHECNNISLTALSIYGAMQGTEYGIRMNHTGIAGALPNNITGCNIAHLAYAISMTGTITSTSVVGNVFYDVVQGVLSQSAANINIGNQKNGDGTLYTGNLVPKDTSAFLGATTIPYNTMFIQAIAMGTPNATRFSLFSGDAVGNVTVDAAALIPTSPGATFLGTGASPFGQTFVTGLALGPANATRHSSLTGDNVGNVTVDAASLVPTAPGATFLGTSPNPFGSVFATESVMTKGLGVFGATPPTTRPTVTGSRGGNAALASLLSALAATGIIADGTTA
jgi:hypothetical protein